MTCSSRSFSVIKRVVANVKSFEQLTVSSDHQWDSPGHGQLCDERLQLTSPLHPLQRAPVGNIQRHVDSDRRCAFWLCPNWRNRYFCGLTLEFHLWLCFSKRRVMSNRTACCILPPSVRWCRREARQPLSARSSCGRKTVTGGCIVWTWPSEPRLGNIWLLPLYRWPHRHSLMLYEPSLRLSFEQVTCLCTFLDGLCNILANWITFLSYMRQFKDSISRCTADPCQHYSHPHSAN